MHQQQQPAAARQDDGGSAAEFQYDHDSGLPGRHSAALQLTAVLNSINGCPKLSQPGSLIGARLIARLLLHALHLRPYLPGEQYAASM
jgi:hypothetical protein